MYETDKRKPDMDTLKQLADFFGVTVDELLERSNPPHTNSLKQNKRPQDLEKILEDQEEIRSIVELQLYKRAKELNKRRPKEDKPRD